jgi:LmbE family N-acetylglucosaminyl deacetylase
MATILGIGAHYDDCVFGVSGILLKALRQHHRVVVLALIGDYSNWRPARGRERELVDGAVRLAKDCGVEMRFLNFAEMKFGVSDETTRAVAEAVADIAPDVALALWPNDQHPDHEVASRLSKVALRYADRLIDASRRFTPTQRIYQFDNGLGTPSASSRTPSSTSRRNGRRRWNGSDG